MSQRITADLKQFDLQSPPSFAELPEDQDTEYSQSSKDMQVIQRELDDTKMTIGSINDNSKVSYYDTIKTDQVRMDDSFGIPF